MGLPPQATTVKLFALLSKREGVLQQRAEMRASANDPNRLLAKGAGVARRLLQEERLRTTIEKACLPPARGAVARRRAP